VPSAAPPQTGAVGVLPLHRPNRDLATWTPDADMHKTNRVVEGFSRTPFKPLVANKSSLGLSPNPPHSCQRINVMQRSGQNCAQM